MGILDEQTLSESITYISVLVLPVSFINGIYLRSKLNVPFIIYFGGTMTILTIFSIWLLFEIDSIILVRIFGILLIITFFILLYIHYFKKKNNDIITDKTSKDLTNIIMDTYSDENMNNENEMEHEQLIKNFDKNKETGIDYIVDSWSKRLILIFVGICAGLARGLFGTGGIPTSIFVLLSNINKDQFRGSMSVCNAIRDTIAFMQILFIQKEYRNDRIIEYISIVIIGIIGLIIGNIISKYVNQELFHLFIMYIILGGGILLTFRDLNEHYLFDFFLSISLILIGLLLFIINFFFC